MRNPLRALLPGILLVFLVILFAGVACGEPDTQTIQRDDSIEARAEAFGRAEDKWPIPRTENFPLRGVLSQYTERSDLINHPWYTYIMADNGQLTHFFVSTAVPVNSCAFLSSTEDIRDDDDGNLILTAPSLDGVYYGGAGASAACNGWIFVDAATGAMGLAFGTKILTFDAPLILETEPLLIQPIAPQ